MRREQGGKTPRGSFGRSLPSKVVSCVASAALATMMVPAVALAQGAAAGAEKAALAYSARSGVVTPIPNGPTITIDKNRFGYGASLKSITASSTEAGEAYQVRLDVEYADTTTNPMAGISFSYVLDNETVTDNAIARECYRDSNGEKAILTKADSELITKDNLETGFIFADCTVYDFSVPKDASDIEVWVDGLTTWQFSDGELSIDGSGRMASFSTTSNVDSVAGNPISETSGVGSAIATFPWHKHQLGITSVVMSDDITFIGKQAFRKLVNMRSFTFSTGLKEIGETAFSDDACDFNLSGCAELEAVASGAFTGLKVTQSGDKRTITVRNGRAFLLFKSGVQYSKDTTEVTFEGIENAVIKDNGWTAIAIDNDCILSEYTGTPADGVVTIPTNVTDTNNISHKVTELANGLLQGETSVNQVVFPSDFDLAVIPNNFVYGSSANPVPLTQITIPSCVTSIGSYAFATYSKVMETKAVDGKNLEDLSNGAFANSGLETNATVTFSDKLEHMGQLVFKNMGNIIEFTSGNYENLKMDPSAFGSFIGTVVLDSGVENADAIIDAALNRNAVDNQGQNQAKVSAVIVLGGDETSTEYVFSRDADYKVTGVTMRCNGYTLDQTPEEWHGVPVTAALDMPLEYAIADNCNLLYRYDLVNKQCCITGFNGTLPAELSIPETIDGKPVAEISDSAFYNQTNLVTVNLPNSITSIGDYAFCNVNMGSDKTLELPGSLASIGARAFRNTGASIRFTSESCSIGAQAFAGNRGFIDMSSVRDLTVEKNTSTDANSSTFMANQIYVRDAAALKAIKDAGNDTKDGIYGVTNGGSVANPSGVSKTLVEPAKDGTSFVTWCSDESLNNVVGSNAISQSAAGSAFYAKWGSCTVSFDSNGHGTAPTSKTVTGGSAVDNPGDLSADGYTFGGWFTEQSCHEDSRYAFGSIVTDNITLYAKWTANDYEITYELNSGISGEGAPSKHVYGTETMLVDPSRTGYTFSGWFTSSDFAEGAEVKSLAADGYTDNVKLYAKWTANTYTVQFDANGGSGDAMASQAFTYDIEQPLSANTYTKSGCYFNGWKNESTGEVYKDNQPVKNLSAENNSSVTLKAQWAYYDYTPAPKPEPEPTPDPEEPAAPAAPAVGESVVVEGGSAAGATVTVTAAADESGKGGTVAYAAPANSTAKSVTVPETVEIGGVTYTVTEVAANAFAGNTSLESVTLPATITKIGAFAFDKCSNLAELNIPGSVTSIGQRAFAYTAITSAVIPAGVEMGTGVYRGCTKLAKVTIEKGVTAIKSYTFKGCTSLKKVTIPSTVTKIGRSAFSGCSKLGAVTVPAKVTKIGKNAFYKTKTTKLVIASKKLTKASVKGCLHGSNIETVKVAVSTSAKVNKSYAAKYAKLFAKSNSGKSVKVTY